MLKDFRDGNKDLITMFKGTDKTHLFQYTEDSGSVFIWSNYIVTAEGRLYSSKQTKDFTFSVSKVVIDDQTYGSIVFPSSIVNTNIRENRIYYRVLAQNITTSEVKVINYGEILLKEA
jgi:hypothetical protein